MSNKFSGFRKISATQLDEAVNTGNFTVDGAAKDIEEDAIYLVEESSKLYRHELIFDEFSFSIYTRDSNAYTDVSEFKDKLPEYVPAAYYDDTYAGGVMLHTKYSYGSSDEIDANLTGVVNVWAGDSEVLPINRELTLANAFWEDRVTEI